MAKRIICKNEDGVQVEFNYSFEPFFLVSVDGIYTVSNNVVTSENTMVDGSTYQGSTTKQRNIVITAQMERDYQANRDLLYKCFKPKSTGLFTYIISIHASAREATALITKIHLKHHISFQHTVHKSPFNVNYPFQ